MYHNDERLVKMGEDDHYVKKNGGRSETFEIADDEQLIGCELYHTSFDFLGVTWIKWKFK